MDIQMKKQNKQSFTYGYVTYYMDESMDLFCYWLVNDFALNMSDFDYKIFLLRYKLYYNKYIIIVNIATFPVFEILKIWSVHIFDREMNSSHLAGNFKYSFTLVG